MNPIRVRIFNPEDLILSSGNCWLARKKTWVDIYHTVHGDQGHPWKGHGYRRHPLPVKLYESFSEIYALCSLSMQESCLNLT